MTLFNLGLGPVVICVTGSRIYNEKDVIYNTLKPLADGRSHVTLWHGKCNPMLDGEFVEWDWALEHPNRDYVGADWLADEIAREEGWGLRHYPADWFRGRGAGPARNARMIKDGPDVVAGFRKGRSSGTIGCLEMALRAGIPVISP